MSGTRSGKAPVEAMRIINMNVVAVEGFGGWRDQTHD